MKIDKQLEQRVGTLHGVRLFLRPSSILGSLLLWLLFRRVAERQLGLEEDEVKTAASLLTIAHWLSDLLHQLGHARAARHSSRVVASTTVCLAKGGRNGSAALVPKPEDPPNPLGWISTEFMASHRSFGLGAGSVIGRTAT